MLVESSCGCGVLVLGSSRTCQGIRRTRARARTHNATRNTTHWIALCALASMVSKVPKRGAESEAWHSFGGAGVGGVACSAETNEQLRAAGSSTVNSFLRDPPQKGKQVCFAATAFLLWTAKTFLLRTATSLPRGPRARMSPQSARVQGVLDSPLPPCAEG